MFSTHLQQHLHPLGRSRRELRGWLAQGCTAQAHLPHSHAAAVLQLHTPSGLRPLQSRVFGTHVLKPCLVAGTQQPRSHSLRGGVATTAYTTNMQRVMRA